MGTHNLNWISVKIFSFFCSLFIVKWVYIRRSYDILNVWCRLNLGPMSTGKVYRRFRARVSRSKILETGRNLILCKSKTSSERLMYVQFISCVQGEPFLNIPVSKLRNIPKTFKKLFAKIIEQVSAVNHFCKELHVRCLPGFWFPVV